MAIAEKSYHFVHSTDESEPLDGLTGRPRGERRLLGHVTSGSGGT